VRHRCRLAASADRSSRAAAGRAVDGDVSRLRHGAVLRDRARGERLRPRVRQRDLLAAPDLAGYRVPLLTTPCPPRHSGNLLATPPSATSGSWSPRSWALPPLRSWSTPGHGPGRPCSTSDAARVRQREERQSAWGGPAESSAST